MSNKLRSIRFFGAAILLPCLVLVNLVRSVQTVSAEDESTNKTTVSKPSVETFGAVPLVFEENRGQIDSRVKFFARGTGYNLFLTATDAVYLLSDSKSKATAVYMRLTGANPNAGFAGSDELRQKTNYFKGSETSKWQTDVPNFAQVSVDEIYQNIDMVWKGREKGQAQYDFVVAPNADPAQIEWIVEGAQNVSLTADGDILIETETGVIRHQKPFSYQETNGFQSEIESGFRIERAAEKFRIKFNIGDYDTTKPLVIDPTVNLSNLAMSTYIGGFQDDELKDIAVDRVGNIYVGGVTQSVIFPTTPGSFDTTQNGGIDCLVLKLNAAGTALIYATYIGGAGSDHFEALEIDASGNAYLTGATLDSTTDYPTTIGAYDTTHGGQADVFVTKLNPTGSALLYSTFIGGASDERAFNLKNDDNGNVYVTGQTLNTLPTTTGAFDTTYNGGIDAFVAKLNATGTALVYSTYIGGSGNDFGYGLAIDSGGNAFIVGSTLDDTTDYPTTTGAFDTTANGAEDAFITKFNATGTALVYSTFLGGSAFDEALDVTVDAVGNAFLTGRTTDGTTDFPTVTLSFDTTHNGAEDAFVTKVNPTGASLVYSTFLGGSDDDKGTGIVLDEVGQAIVTGETTDGTTDFPTTTGAFDTTVLNTDAFVTKLYGVPAGPFLPYSTFLGGTSGGNDQGAGVAIDDAGNVFVVGRTGTASFPTTPEAFQSTQNGGFDSFVSKLGDFSIAGRVVDTAGLPIANTSIGLSGPNDGFQLTDAQGYFGFADTAANGSFIIAASHLTYNFTPTDFQAVNLNGNRRYTFLGRPTSSGPTAAFVEIGGRVESVVGQTPLANTTLTLIDPVSNQVRTVTSDEFGRYKFTNVAVSRFYIVIPQREGYNFNPGYYEMNLFDDALGTDFLAVPNAPRPVRDFDGDGKTDLAVFRPAEGNWYILQSQNNSMKVVNFGVAGDVPLAADYDGDRRADVAVYRPTEGNWYRLNSSDNAFSAIRFGISEDRPVPADFDGDGRADISVYRPSTGVWHRLNSADGQYRAEQFGLANDVPVPADFDADGRADLTVYRNGVWYRQNSSNGQTLSYQFGLSTDVPLTVDFDGDGRMDTAVFRPSDGTWYWQSSSDGAIKSARFGLSTDVPVPADYNGDGRFEPAVFRHGAWYVLKPDNNFYTAQFGTEGDQPTTSAIVP